LNKAWHITSAPDLPPNTALKSPKRILSDQKNNTKLRQHLFSFASIGQLALSFV
jgi:hypothetical protein